MDRSTPLAPAPDPLHDAARMAELIADVTGVSPDEAARRLRAEFDRPGRSVVVDFARRGLTPFVWGQGLIDFYGRTDAFLYELAVWNRNAMKRRMRRWVVRYLGRAGRPLDVLSIGDGLGFDCLALARAGHRVTYFEVPGYTEAFARRLIDSAGVSVSVVTDFAALPAAAFDAVCCLDVLEHVPDPPAQVRDMAGRLRPGGLLLASAPFWLIHPAFPTHLRSNRRYSGSLRLFTANGFALADGQPMWDPLVFRNVAGDGPGGGAGAIIPPAGAGRRALVRMGGLVLKAGRWTGLPAWAAERVRRRTKRWFE